MATPAFAQDTNASVESEAEAPTSTIVVTGSRLARPELDASSPVAVIGAEEFQIQQTVNVEEVLNDLPQIVPATTGVSNNPGGGIASVDLRGIGTQRTLVLVDGRRYINFGTDQTVDLNTIPASLIERVDVVTGGASAVYGSDAIAGVVNFVLKKDFEGVEVNSNLDISEQGDGKRYNIDATIGANFADGRGNVVLHVGYNRRESVFAGDRAATRVSFSDVSNGQGGRTLIPGGSSLIPSFRVGITGLAQRLGLSNGANDAVRFDQNGNAVLYNANTDLYNFGPVNYLQVPQKRIIGYAKADYEVSSHLTTYIEATFANNRVDTELAATPIGNTTPFRGGSLGSAFAIHVYSPFLGSATQAALQALDTDGDGYVSSGAYGRRFLETGSRNQADDRNAYRVLAGVKGNITGSWDYDAYYSYSRTRNSQVQEGNIQLSAFLASTRTAFRAPNGTISVTPVAGGTLVCADAAARANGCVPANVYGENKVSAEAAEYLSISATNLTQASTQVASAVITNNDLADLGAGGIGLAFGVEHRREAAKFQPDTFLASGDVGGFNAGNPTTGAYNLTELFAELNVPLLADRPFFERLEVNGAARFSDYSNGVGSVWTYAVGSTWEPGAGLLFRGNYQRAIRGPSINELFGGQTVSFDGAVDPCQTAAAATGTLRTRCIASGVPASVVGTNYSTGGTSFPGLVGGNPNLSEERATTWTVGGAFTPDFFRNFSLTVDYYNIEIKDYIGTVGNQNIANGCLLQGIDDFCSLFTRSPNGEFQQFVNFNRNAGSLKTDGIDVAARLKVPLGFGLASGNDAQLEFAFNGTYLMTLDYVAVAGVTPVNECAGRFGRVCSRTVSFAPTPDWKHTLRTTYRDGPGFLSLQWRYIGSSTDEDRNTLYAVERLRSANYFDLTAGIDVNDNLTFNFGVRNLFNKGFQPIASNQQGGNGQQSNTYPTLYDPLGRYFSASATVRF
ncbi:TonB-dependent receptor domain-containing protein [Erythrobacter sp. NE805]|uniref:TonB-dependent receptor domain-containing protein n=1 Tax=Erythrobacter sp. NE805 TaxID=3389875 RepID=UPI00396AF955